MGTWSSHIPEQFPSLRSTRCRRCSGKPPSFFWSWWPHNIYLWVLLPGRIGDSPSEGSYWWMRTFSAAGGASAAPWPSLPDTWTLDMKWGEFLLTSTDPFNSNLHFPNGRHLPVSQVGPVYPGWQWQTGAPLSKTWHSPFPQCCPLQAGGSCRRSQYWPW